MENNWEFIWIYSNETLICILAKILPEEDETIGNEFSQFRFLLVSFCQ